MNENAKTVPFLQVHGYGNVVEMLWKHFKMQ